MNGTLAQVSQGDSQQHVRLLPPEGILGCVSTARGSRRGGWGRDGNSNVVALVRKADEDGVDMTDMSLITRFSQAVLMDLPALTGTNQRNRPQWTSRRKGRQKCLCVCMCV